MAVTTTADLSVEVGGAGSGVYNTMRQLGGVLGAAGVAALMQARLSVLVTPGDGGPGGEMSLGTVPPVLRRQFASAMGQCLLLPAAVAAAAAVAAVFLQAPHHPHRWSAIPIR